MSDLHDAIMSLDPPESASDFGDRLDEQLAAAYRRGFRAARLAAAELVSAQPAAPAEPKGADGLPVSAPRLYADEEPPEPAASAELSCNACVTCGQPVDAAHSVAPEPVAWIPRERKSGQWILEDAADNPNEPIHEACYYKQPVFAHPPRAPLQDEHPYTYASTQATNCAGCGEYKHTPLRIDAMGGYVCLTCIDGKLGTLLGEFGYPPRAPLTDDEVDLLWRKAYADHCGTTMSFDWFEAGVRALEARISAHGIGGK